MYHFQYVTKEQLAPAKQNLIDLIHFVQDEIRDDFTFQYKFIGSVARNMVTYDPKTNIGYDFDVNLIVNDDNEDYGPSEIKHILMDGFNKHAHKFNFDFCEDSTRVFTIKVKDKRNSKTIYSCDFAIIHDYGENQQEYIRFNKPYSYVWAEQPKGFYCLSDKINFCKENGLWKDIRDLYIIKKNSNFDKFKKSRSIFAETIHEICQQNGYYED